jgi:hydroxymethylglutaryl-CoA reductase (NADPH)
MAPSPILRQLYTVGSLDQGDGHVRFGIKNRLFDASLVGVGSVSIDGELVPLSDVALEQGDHTIVASGVDQQHPLDFPLHDALAVRVTHGPLGPGPHTVGVTFRAEPFGELAFEVEDSIIPRSAEARSGPPRNQTDNYSPDIVAARQRYLEEQTGVKLEHLNRPSFDPHITDGNVENFIGVAQVPLGLAGPVRVNGEHAQGEFLIPMATAEGTLVASYNRGMKVLNACGGATVSVVDDCMQRAPVFIFESAREARDFKTWVDDHLEEIAKHAEATTSVGKLLYIDTFLASKFAFLRFNFSTGDAAGQNMVGRATFAACSWILEQLDTVRRFFLESNFATDKKASQVNMMRTRGKRVTAEVTIPRSVLTRIMRVEPAQLHYHAGVANVGSFLSGVNNNGLHSANGITAMFIATGQDVANVSEGSAGVVYCDLLSDGALYLSITIPSLIVATHGGGVGLATQRECLEILGCYGRGKVNKLAEIIGAVVLAGEISLASAISSLDWVSSHEQYGRNR